MRENLSGFIKLFGITILLIALWIAIGMFTSGKAMGAENIKNVLERSSLYAIIGIGVAFVIMTSGIDLSLGSLACLSACMFVWLVQVSYIPIGDVEVVQAIKSSDNSSLIVKGGPDQFSKGQWLRLIPGKKSRLRAGVFQATSVSSGPTEGTLKIGLSASPSRSEKSKDGQAIARIVALKDVVNFKVHVPSDSLSTEKGSEHSFDTSKGYSTLAFSSAGSLTSSDFAKKNRIVLVSESGLLGEAKILDSRNNSGNWSLDLDRKSKLDSGNWHWFVMKRQARTSLLGALALTLLFAIGIGLIHGLLVSYWNLQPFVVTLCGFMIYRGAARWLTNDQSVGFGTEYSDTWMTFPRLSWAAEFGSGSGFAIPIPGSGETLTIPMTFFVLLFIAVFAIVFMNFTIWGRYLLAVGRNEQASRFSGIHTASIKVVAYVLCSLLAAVAGLINVMDTGDVSPTNGCNYWELYAIAAAVLGGCSLRGGEGSIIGVVIGATLMQTIKNGVILLGIPDTVELTVLGFVIMFGVSFDEVVRRMLAMRRGSVRASSESS